MSEEKIIQLEYGYIARQERPETDIEIIDEDGKLVKALTPKDVMRLESFVERTAN
jgi:hypothetical protein